MSISETQFFTIGKTKAIINLPVDKVTITPQYTNLPKSEVDWVTGLTRYRARYTPEESTWENLIPSEIRTWASFIKENFYFINNNVADVPVFYLSRGALKEGYTTSYMPPNCSEYRFRILANDANKYQVQTTICTMNHYCDAKYKIIGGRFDVKEFPIGKGRLPILRVWVYYTGDAADFELAFKDLLAKELHGWLGEQKHIYSMINW